MMKPLHRNLLIALAVVLFAVFVWPTAYIYGGGADSPWRRNRITGQIQRYSDGRWYLR